MSTTLIKLLEKSALGGHKPLDVVLSAILWKEAGLIAAIAQELLDSPEKSVTH